LVNGIGKQDNLLERKVLVSPLMCLYFCGGWKKLMGKSSPIFL